MTWCATDLVTTTTSPVTTTTTYSTGLICEQLSATPGDGQALLRWAAAGGSGDSRIIGYVVMPYLGSFALQPRVVMSARTSDVVSGLVNGLTYRFRSRS